MITRYVLSFIVLIGLTPTASSAEKALILKVDFESSAIGPYNREVIRKEWEGVKWEDLYDRAQIIQDPEGARGKVLKVVYPKGAVGPEDGGAQFLISLQPAKELWLSYHVKFDNKFDFSRGGKLPGLTSGGSHYTGGRKPEEGEGWSARYMWREEGRAFLYLYYIDMPNDYGEYLALKDFAFTPGAWHKITQHIKVNAATKADGIIEVWVDGKKALSRSDLRLRVGSKGLIDSLYFSTFHGGGDKGWAPRKTCFALFDKFVVSRKPLDSEK